MRLIFQFNIIKVSHIEKFLLLYLLNKIQDMNNNKKQGVRDWRPIRYWVSLYNPQLRLHIRQLCYSMAVATNTTALKPTTSQWVRCECLLSIVLWLIRSPRYLTNYRHNSPTSQSASASSANQSADFRSIINIPLVLSVLGIDAVLITVTLEFKHCYLCKIRLRFLLKLYSHFTAVAFSLFARYCHIEMSFTVAQFLF